MTFTATKYLYLAEVLPDDERTGKKGKASFCKFKSIDIFRIVMDLFDNMIKQAAEYQLEIKNCLEDDSWLEIPY